MAKRKAKYTKADKTAAEKMFEHLPKPIPPMGAIMTNRNKKREKKFDAQKVLSEYQKE